MTTFDLAAVDAGLAGTTFSGRVLHFPSVGSTNALALEAAQSGARAGVWVADEQTAGRGRGGHSWHSAAGDGLYASALVALALPMTMALWLPLSTGLAAQAAIAEVAEIAVDIRWPNDLLLNGRKCGGILVETAASPAQDVEVAMLRYAVIGIGINVNHAAFPAEIEALATSLRMESRGEVSREALLIALLRALDEEIELLMQEHRERQVGAGLLQRFASASSWVRGKRVKVDEGGGYTGVTAGLDGRGFLLVDGDDGVLHTVLSGGVREG
ncbi:biotin--[acetyl-CoA-carboxylase] ligase [Edaphobacter paludis]|uniref:biotin--[biotin carboxyl-carrier protein] ligase n=1 Tax=Edaphobacter paludis TaxID=3035702 RepID=A0AAU7D033_9BACT